MNKIQEGVYKAQNGSRGGDHSAKEHIPVVTNTVRHTGKPTVGNIKGAVETAILTPSDSEVVRKQLESKQGVWDRSSGKLGYVFYKVLLS